MGDGFRKFVHTPKSYFSYSLPEFAQSKNHFPVCGLILGGTAMSRKVFKYKLRTLHKMFARLASGK